MRTASGKSTEQRDHSGMDLPAIAGGAPLRGPDCPVRFGAPLIGEHEIAAVADCLRTGWIGPGERVCRFELEFARYKAAPYAIAVSSGTSAIFLALTALRIGPGDEVIAPTMTYCSTVHSIVHTGATPVLADCDARTFNLDPDGLERLITPRTRAILAVHMCGRCCEMDAILAIAQRHRLFVVEDCAHAIEARYHGRPVGLLGDIGCFSFYATKNITTADGGMILTHDRRLHRRLTILSRQGMVGSAWERSAGRSRRSSVVAAGFKCNMTDMEASLGIAQLASIEDRWKSRERLWRLYDELLQGLPLAIPCPPEPGTRHAFHLYTPLLDLESIGISRDEVAAALRAENIGSGIHFIPVHRLSYYRRRFGFRASDFPRAASVGERTISLPLSACHTEDDVRDTCQLCHRMLPHMD